MSKLIKFLYFSIISIALLACNLPGGAPPTIEPDYISTITAQAGLLLPSNTAPVTVIIVTATPDLSQPSTSDTTSALATITLSPTPGVATLTVSADTNCRSGPGKEYDNLGALLINETAEIVGKNTITNYWIIKNPDRDGTCWLWGKYATTSGDLNKLQEYAIPATPTPTAPKPVANLSANKICFFDGIGYKLNGFITWEDSDTEEQYMITLNGNPHGLAGPNATTYAIPAMNLVPGGTITMGVLARSDFGESPMREITISCP